MAARNSGAVVNGRRRSEVDTGESTPICRCRVLYLGSAVPHVTKDGLQGIQEPLRELYPDQGAMGAKGIDSWLSVWSNGLLLENVDENHKRVTRFFPIESLHYCAAVRYVLVPAVGTASASVGPGLERIARFLPLDSPFARQPNINHPPLFACIMRRTTGIKVLECHVFICKRETAANALVRCCFHAYADSTYAHHLENGGPAPPAKSNGTDQVDGDMTLNSIEKVQGWRMQQQQGGPLLNGTFAAKNGQPIRGADDNGNGSTSSSHGMGSASVSMLILDNGSQDDDSSIINNGDANHKVWTPSNTEHPVVPMYGDYGTSNTMRSIRSTVSVSTPAKPSRPRQISAVVPPPPPPVIDETGDRRLNGKKKDKSKGKNRSADEMEELASEVGVPGVRRPSSVFNFPINGHRPPTIGALHPLPGHPGMVGYPVFSGRGPRGQPPMPPPPAYLVPVPMPMPLGKKSKSGAFKFGTFSARGKKSKSALGGGPIMFLPPPPNGPPLPPGPPMLAAPAPMALGMPVPLVAPPLSMRRSSSRMTLSAEEPIYMPAAVRPISPIASYQPAHFPHEAYLMQQQYAGSDLMATLPRPLKTDAKSKNKKNKKKDKKSPEDGSLLGDGADAGEESSVISHSGIYRKGHINERAFSYSIRQEHRSRSYSSLANYPATGADPLDLRERDKKERELIQMVHDLDLSGDDLERSEVPMAMYPHHRQPR